MHQEEHLKSSDFITDMVIGMSDGLTVPFALAAGLSGAVSDNSIILTAGIAEIVAGCIAMGLGGYLAGKTEIEHYQSELSREYQEVDTVPEKEMEEVKEIFAEYGLSTQAQELIATELAKDKTKWVNFMMKFELGLEAPNPARARNSALTIGASYFVGGLLPLSAYLFTNTPEQGLIGSTILTVICLFVFGYFKSKVTGQPAVQGAFKVTLIGLLAAAAAFGIAKLVS
ncbi:VIT1/CCC1 family predicted Fe2+/Mn2+ transporter [Chitinophaga terrae (ex Kim and Jung 2007)]|uniref:VIT1/CCC1 transporter family protein n=1 Tax=Chitinophaga terrae (ex Kim and Jung 2007) TaxID=408074 RepID=UPI00277E6109|nr:VIT1/CCC1 transporter family protein [Chitinophaga terrae (ex Kim and Jung 2007)]MDQ0108933.1 VIT1/CCC1 family predicted Fe2+/Mn2+ transporter [Chitinophaga terrae (ex Kim and Jung 2007)]